LYCPHGYTLYVNGVVRGGVQTLLPDPLTTSINRPPRDSPRGRNPVHLLLSTYCLTPSLPTTCLFTFAFSWCSESGSLQLFDPNIWHPPCSKPKKSPDDASEELANICIQMKAYPKLPTKTILHSNNHPLKPSQQSLKLQSI
jgi:hypothetical protein